MLLLQSGTVLKGEITQTTDEWVVTNPTRQVKVRKSDTLARGQSAADLYAWQREKLVSQPASIHNHLRLADWCLGQQLWMEASRELLDARQMNADSPQLRILERRLIQMSQNPAVQPKPRAIPKTTNNTHDDWQTIEESWKVSNEQAADFSRKIHPLLVNNCTTSGCHRTGSDNQYQLDISLRQGYGNAESNRRNMLSTLRTLDRDNPDGSVLLQAARGPHAGGQGLTGPHRDAWIAMLETWVEGVANANSLAKEQSAEPDNKEVVQVAQANNIQEASPNASDVSKQELHPTEQTFTPRDEFDPEIFNRLFRNNSDQSDQ